jgi:hypothetical protein
MNAMFHFPEHLRQEMQHKINKYLCVEVEEVTYVCVEVCPLYHFSCVYLYCDFYADLIFLFFSHFFLYLIGMLLWKKMLSIRINQESQLWVRVMVFNTTWQYFRYIVAVSVIVWGNRRTLRKPSTFPKSPTNFIT